MKIILVSDSHGENTKLDLLVNRHKDIDVYIHCGDSESDPYSIYPFTSVKGNCDHHNEFMNQLLISTPIGNLLVKHICDVSKDTLNKLKVKAFAFGHTHRRLFSKVDNIYYINPGSISLPRDSNGLSYAILEIDKDDLKVNFLNI